MKCLDTYALIEICDGNPKFSALLTEEVVVPDLTMAEFYADLYRKYGKQTADYWHRKLSPVCISVPREILIKAVTYRIDHKTEKLSFFDCVGYMFALERGMIFVTGDKEFRHKPQVQFMLK